VWVSRLNAGEQLSRTFEPQRGGYAYVIDGDAGANGHKLGQGYAVKIEGPEELLVEASSDCELILIEAPLRYAPVGVWARQ
jgi:quercetin 2,3-dioxygenase